MVWFSGRRLTCLAHQSGIGLELAEHLYSRGYRLGITGRRQELGESVVKSIDSTGEDVIFVPCDVSSYDDQAKLFRAVWDRWGRIEYVDLYSILFPSAPIFYPLVIEPPRP